MTLKTQWIDHLKENNMTYLQHLFFAVRYGSLCLIAGILLISHAIFPCWFQTSGSDLVRKMALVFKKHTHNTDT
jgi:hypothetical protein